MNATCVRCKKLSIEANLVCGRCPSCYNEYMSTGRDDPTIMPIPKRPTCKIKIKLNRGKKPTVEELRDILNDPAITEGVVLRNGEIRGCTKKAKARYDRMTMYKASHIGYKVPTREIEDLVGHLAMNAVDIGAEEVLKASSATRYKIIKDQTTAQIIDLLREAYQDGGYDEKHKI